MNLRQLKAFQAVCRTGNITRASELIHLSQPALTRQIQELESYCGCKLFERTRHGIVLTDEGELLQVRAEEMLSLAERTRRELKEAGGFTGGIVRIGCVESSAAQELSQLLAKWQQSTPGVRNAEFELYAADGDDIRSSLDEERLDVGILLEPVETAKYDSLPLSSADRWGVVVRVESSAAQELSQLLAKWQQSTPGVRNAEFELYAADGDDIRSSLDEERLDVGILLEPVETAKYDSLPLSSADRWGVVVRSDSPEAQHPTLTQDELVKLPLILPRRHIVIDTLHQWFNGGPEPLKIAGYHNLLTNALTLVKAGLGNLLCVEGSWTIRETPGFVFIPLSPVRLARHRLVRKKNRLLSRTAESFWAYAADHWRSEESDTQLSPKMSDSQNH